MLYTLLKFLGWGMLLAFIGGCIGWALRALKSRGEVAAAQSADGAEDVASMRNRLADLDQIVAERDRLRIQLADVRHADSPGIVSADVPPPAAHAAASMSSAVVDDARPERDDPAEGEADDDELVEPSGDTEPVVVDLDAATATLGKKIRLDDLAVVEGIGPKISELCSGIGITTWRQLADTDVAVLQSMLDAAGSRYAVHKPGSWPQQAGLLAAGKWADFQAFTGDLGSAE